MRGIPTSEILRSWFYNMGQERERKDGELTPLARMLNQQRDELEAELDQRIPPRS